MSLSDTVGFIRDLPHKLVEAFQATLSEAVDADLLLHVIDASSTVLQEQKDEVDRVLEDIGASDVPQILVFNKLDRVDPTAQPRGLVDAMETPLGRRVHRVFVSAREGTGLEELRDLIAEMAAQAGSADTWHTPSPLHEEQAPPYSLSDS